MPEPQSEGPAPRNRPRWSEVKSDRAIRRLPPAAFEGRPAPAAAVGGAKNPAAAGNRTLVGGGMDPGTARAQPSCGFEPDVRTLPAGRSPNFKSRWGLRAGVSKAQNPTGDKRKGSAERSHGRSGPARGDGRTAAAGRRVRRMTGFPRAKWVQEAGGDAFAGLAPVAFCQAPGLTGPVPPPTIRPCKGASGLG